MVTLKNSLRAADAKAPEPPLAGGERSTGQTGGHRRRAYTSKDWAVKPIYPLLPNCAMRSRASGAQPGLFSIS
jgi:hypothetical protein